MIPTSATSSPTAAAAAVNYITGGMNNSETNGQNHYTSTIFGIASLILEGRPISDDEYQPINNTQRTNAIDGSSILANESANHLDGNSTNGSHTSAAASGSQSPRSTMTRTASASASGSVINITTNPYVSVGSTNASMSFMTPAYSSNAFIETNMPLPSMSSSSSSTTITTATTRFNENTHQRWTQKLCQLRQISPAAQSITTEPELVSLAINDHPNAERTGNDFEIVRRVMLNRASLSATANASSVASPINLGGSDNILHSLQSLATTCLRGSSPTLDATPLAAHISHYAPTSTPPASNYPAFTPRFPNCSYVPTTTPTTLAATMNMNDTNTCGRLNTVKTATATTTKVTMKSAKSATTTRPQHGPHCDQFLRKMGLSKCEASDAEEHFCDMTYVNLICSRWRAFCTKIGAVIERNEPICIEVYLGPAPHKILLEQWIITVKEKMPPPTMTLPSLCSAIRSQLYFSQIVAWCDLLRKSDKSIYDTGRIIFSNTIGSAGDLVMPSSANVTPSSSPSANATPPRQPRLNIFYRIKSYDGMDAFNTKPNVHNFPSVNVSDNVSISVCVKSLPRINGGIPKVVETTTTTPATAATTTPSTPTPTCSSIATTAATAKATPPQRLRLDPCDVSTPTYGGSFCAATPNGLAARTTTATRPTADNVATPRTSRLTQHRATLQSRRCSVSAAINNCDKKSHNNATVDSKSACHAKNNCGAGSQLSVAASRSSQSKDESDYFITQAANNGYCTVNYALLSHREKQLQKYRKRMLKRDKKRDRSFFDVSNNRVISDDSFEETSSNNSNSRVQPMDQCDEDQDSNNSINSNSNNSNSNSNSNGNGNCNGISVSNQIRAEMVSTGTQTPLICCQQCGSVKNFVCLNCCPNEDGNRFTNQADEFNVPMCSSSVVSSVPAVSAPSKADILLQAIQRTPKNKKTTEQLTRCSKNNVGHDDLNKTMCPPQSIIPNNNHVGHKVLPNLRAGCRVCKRQKTQHVFSNGHSSSNNSVINENNVEVTVTIADVHVDAGAEVQSMANGDSESDDWWDKSSLSGSGKSTQGRVCKETELTSSSTKPTPQINLCSIAASDAKDSNDFTKDDKDLTTNQPEGFTTPPMEPITDVIDEDNLDCGIVMQFKTPAPNMLPQQTTTTKSDIFRKSPKPKLLRIPCNYPTDDSEMILNITDSKNVTPNHLSPQTLRKVLPKVNLTPIFCNPATSIASAQSAPIPINSCDAIQLDAAFSFDKALLNHSQSHTKVSEVADDNIPVQKSYSAPTLPNSLSLSPRFAKQASFYKRRSRHLSDRSDRSSLGSDEQLSDEDYDGCQFSPATSPLKGRFRITTQFGRQPLLGNLEESLLQKRLMPKMEVLGFKVLLGASGGFCPTQLTIPAAAYFYELHGETLSTPYLCEIRLPRKGYSIPRTGTIQATLLNPMGSVVRMFVIPYDLRDMPNLHRTFIRQRILADDSPRNNNNGDLPTPTNYCNNKLDACEMNGNNNMTYNNNNNNNRNNGKLGHFITADQMKRLRYSIHLRFQTSRSGRLTLHTDIRLLISRRTDCDTAAAHAKGVLEAPNELVTDTMMPLEPKYSARQQNSSKI